MAGQPLDISIVGAGIAGLAAAIALRRNGHRVQIFESAEVKIEIGAAIVVAVNAERVLDHFGYDKENLRSVDFVGVENFNAVEGGKSQTGLWGLIDGGAAVMCARTDLHGELERLAIGPGEGPPAVLRLASRVISCNPEDGSLTLSDGSIVTGDLVLGADGISSAIRTHILGYEQKSVRTGITNSRTLLDMAALDAIPELAWLREGVSGPRNVLAFGGPFRLLILYPCRSGTVMNFAAGFEDPHQADPGWAASGTREELLAQFSHYHPQFQALFRMLPDRLPRWQLRFLPALPTWVRGRAALLGDAAHATLPTLGQGASQAMEDAAALGVLLPLGTTRTDIPARLKAYEALRKERAELIGRKSHDQMMVPSERGKYSRDPELQKLVMGYDVLGAARKAYEEQFAGSEN
ncbi:FAD/NAD(P)-binding domain-containing protein [Mycena albidolilacea]|uniref:FAD/NAD(P)-binding domain-containing protein n=1 Tax=Mycena albidolilacea TaxID=1033008 RepID=A0AAD6Z4T7_9AGAR|nr:FAD/NAD(P)-binding domain-containing protein [Mycena albidolilacea]